jgi:predicted O-methyltransferase YrrM
MSNQLGHTQSQAVPEQLGSWIARLLSEDEMLDMGHCQRRVDANLGMGWLYYALARLIRPTRVVVIGSWRGFSPIIFAKALADNAEGGSVTFVDPSFVDDHWAQPARVVNWFKRFGVDNIEHHRMTTQQFVGSEAYRALDEVGIVFIDGYHTQEQAQFDFEAFADRVPSQGLIVLHDSVAVEESGIYGSDRCYLRTVKQFVDQLRQDPGFQVLDLPFDQGLTLVRRNESGASE